MSKNENLSEKISIIIPVYNAEKYIKRCLDSILNQSFKDFEIILVDDGSIDGTSEIVDGFSRTDRRIKVYHQLNKGSLSARFTGIEFSSGRYITFCDADDYYFSNHSLQYMYNSIVDSCCDAVQFNSYVKYRFFKKKRNNCKERIVEKEDFLSHEYPKLLCSYWEESELNVTVWDKIYDRKLADNLPKELSRQRIFMGDDLVLNLFLMEKCNRVKYDAKPLYCYRTLTGSTNKWKEKDLYDLDILKQYQMQIIERQDWSSKEKILRNYYSEIASWLYFHIREGAGRLPQEQLIKYLDEVLNLISFRKAHLYFLEQNRENWEAVNLLRDADSEKYVIR